MYRVLVGDFLFANDAIHKAEGLLKPGNELIAACPELSVVISTKKPFPSTSKLVQQISVVSVHGPGATDIS